MALPFTVKVFVPTGDPEGLRVIEKAGWNGRGLIFPRIQFSEVKQRKELQSPGVYILWGSGASRLPIVYIGEGAKLLPRLESHVQGKSFWQYGVVFVSTDNSLHKAHVQYLEWSLLKRAGEMKLCELENSTKPQEPALPPMDQADANIFLTDMLLCLPIIGVNFFKEEGLDPVGPGPRDLFLRSTKIGVSARARETANNGILIYAGSEARKDGVASAGAFVSNARKVLLANGTLEDAGDKYRFTRDVEFRSPSGAAVVVLGRKCNGLTKWKDSQGRTLKENQEGS